MSNLSIVSKSLQNTSGITSDVVNTKKLLINGVDFSLGSGFNPNVNSIAIGANAGLSQGTLSVAIGSSAGQNIQGVFCVGIGVQAGQDNQGAQSVAIGGQCALTNQGLDSVAVGFQAGANAQGNGSVAVGIQSGFQNQQQTAVSIGYFTGNQYQGTQAVAIGYKAGSGTQGNNAVALGSRSGQTGQGAQSIAIGNLAGQLNQPANSIILNATGVAINGTTASSCYMSPIRSVGVATQSALLAYNTTTNEIQYANNVTFSGSIAATTYYSSSDSRLKKNIEPLPSVLEGVKKLEPVQFNWKNDNKADYGFIAQQFYKQFPFLNEAHNYNGTEFPQDVSGADVFYSMEYSKITAILVKAIQELDEKVELLLSKGNV